MLFEPRTSGSVWHAPTVTAYEQIKVAGAGPLPRTSGSNEGQRGDAPARFAAVGTPGPDWSSTATKLEFAAFRDLLGSQAARTALPELLMPDPFPTGHPPGFAQVPSGALTLDGELAALLVRGGAYERI